MINFKAKCEKTPETPEKQYTEIKFVVVNGTFTENGQTELTKTFEVGTKLTLADIPASKGKSSSYSDQTWDKFPVGYVVGKDGTTFTITYRWRSSGSDSDDSDYDYGTSTRGKATNAAGKSGRWILEGGGFTEDNGTTQEDTCTPAGMRSTASGITSTQHPTREHLAQCLRIPQHRMGIR